MTDEKPIEPIKEELLQPLQPIIPPERTIPQSDRVRTSNLDDDIGVLGGLGFTEVTKNFLSPNDSGVWEDWDLSSIVPSGTKYVEITMRNLNILATAMGARKNGSSSNRYYTIPANGFMTMTTEIDSNRIVERYSADNSNSGLVVTGYWT